MEVGIRLLGNVVHELHVLNTELGLVPLEIAALLIAAIFLALPN